MEPTPLAAAGSLSAPKCEGAGLWILPADSLDTQSPEVRELLEALDDAIFAAIGGCPASLARAHELWPHVVGALGPSLVEESREQYLRYAVDVARQFKGLENRSADDAIAALEVIELLTR